MEKIALRIFGVMAPIMGVLVLLSALGDRLARWGGYSEALPLLGLLILFIVGNLLVTSLTPRRRKAAL